MLLVYATAELQSVAEKTLPHKQRLFKKLMSHVFRIIFSYSDRSCRFFFIV